MRVFRRIFSVYASNRVDFFLAESDIAQSNNDFHKSLEYSKQALFFQSFLGYSSHVLSAYAFALSRVGRLVEAEIFLDRVYENDPKYLVSPDDPGRVLYSLRFYLIKFLAGNSFDFHRYFNSDVISSNCASFFLLHSYLLVSRRRYSECIDFIRSLPLNKYPLSVRDSLSQVLGISFLERELYKESFNAFSAISDPRKGNLGQIVSSFMSQNYGKVLLLLNNSDDWSFWCGPYSYSAVCALAFHASRNYLYCPPFSLNNSELYWMANSVLASTFFSEDLYEQAVQPIVLRRCMPLVTRPRCAICFASLVFTRLWAGTRWLLISLMKYILVLTTSLQN